MESMSLVKRLRMRPTGVRSKNDPGLSSTARSACAPHHSTAHPYRQRAERLASTHQSMKLASRSGGHVGCTDALNRDGRSVDDHKDEEDPNVEGDAVAAAAAARLALVGPVREPRGAPHRGALRDEEQQHEERKRARSNLTNSQ